ncbi:MAG: sigma-70 family RNA polymerase sigma factor [Actinomycetales bacterium]|nr:sigma-70 family RNA polymerase sigma factor [Actinomycetales bacterium]
MSDAARREAFARHVEPEIPVLLRVARTLTGSAADAEDLVQETLIRAYRAMDQFDGAHPRAWLLTILRNTGSNLRRRTRPDLVEDWNALADPKPAFGAERPETPQDAVLVDVLDEELERAINALDARFRAVLVMVDVHGLSYAECAEALGIPVGTVMSRLSRARDRMRKHLKATGRLS